MTNMAKQILHNQAEIQALIDSYPKGALPEGSLAVMEQALASLKETIPYQEMIYKRSKRYRFYSMVKHIVLSLQQQEKT